MAFNYGKTKLKKIKYNIWYVLGSSFAISDLSASMKTALALFNFFGDSATIATAGSNALTNASACVTFYTGATAITFAGITDNKPRLVVNAKSTGNITVGSDTLAVGESAIIASNSISGKVNMLPIGVCAESPVASYKKGDTLKTNDGVDNVIGVLSSFSVECLNLIDTNIKDTLDGKTACIVYTDINDDNAIVIGDMTINVDTEVVGNAQNKAIISCDKEDVSFEMYDNYTA